jgi:hypothetical protein
MIQGIRVGFYLGVMFWILVLLVSPASAHAMVDLSAGLNEGTSSLSNPVSGSTGTSGNQLELLLLATVDVGEPFVIEAGGGWLHGTLSGTASPVSGSFSPLSYDLVTNAAVAELSPQIRVVGGLRVGPVGEGLFGPNVSFVPGFGPGQSFTFLGGGQALYEFRFSGSLVRAGARYLTSLNITDHQLQSIQATLQLGLPVL